jgi:hypothetical protein
MYSVCVCVVRVCVWMGVGLLSTHRQARGVHDHEDQSSPRRTDHPSVCVSQGSTEVSDRASGSASMAGTPPHFNTRLSHHRQFVATPNIVRHTLDRTVHPVPPEWLEAPEFNAENWSTETPISTGLAHLRNLTLRDSTLTPLLGRRSGHREP